MTAPAADPPGSSGPGPLLSSYADLLTAVLGSSIPERHALALLRGPLPGERDALLDSQARLLRAHLGRVAAALASLPQAAVIALIAPHAVSPQEQAPAMTGLDETADRLAQWLIHRLRAWPDAARRLAVATARLLEDSAVLHPAARRQRPLGRGFEPLLDERLRRRFALIPEHAGHLAALSQGRQVLMEEPGQGTAELERALGAPLTADDKAWLEAERRVAMLRFVRRNKTEGGHIRWFLKKEGDRHVVLDRFGVSGHWIICHAGRPSLMAQLGTAVERVMQAQPPPAEAGGG